MNGKWGGDAEKKSAYRMTKGEHESKYWEKHIWHEHKKFKDFSLQLADGHDSVRGEKNKFILNFRVDFEFQYSSHTASLKSLMIHWKIANLLSMGLQNDSGEFFKNHWILIDARHFPTHTHIHMLSIYISKCPFFSALQEKRNFLPFFFAHSFLDPHQKSPAVGKKKYFTVIVDVVCCPCVL